MSAAGKLLLYLYHYPVGLVRDSWRAGGPLAQRQTARNRREMERAAGDLPALPVDGAGPPVVLHLLSGRKFWYQTAFCLHSFARAAQTSVQAEIYDDGTLDAEITGRLLRLGPRLRIHRQADILARLEEHLPAARFPVLRERWRNYPNLRKLTDPHVGSRGWKLVIDSDLLFFRRPDQLLRWFEAPDRPLHAVDCAESYGYSRSLLERLAGAPLPSRVNVGLCGLRGEDLDWEELESWCAELIAAEKTNYYLEQALVAMLMARVPERTVAAADDYLTLPSRSEVEHPRAVMHHYVAESKRWYFAAGWRQIPP